MLADWTGRQIVASCGMPTVAVIGASEDPAKYAYRAVQRFAARGYTVWPVHPSGQSVSGHPCYAGLAQLPGRPDVITMYVNPRIGAGLAEAIAAARPQLVILNPGADGEPVASALRARGIRVLEACTLVLLAQGDPLALADPPA